MNRLRLSLTAALAVLTLITGSCSQADDTTTAGSALQIDSPAFAAGAAIPVRYSCQGASISPPLRWSGVPRNAESLALIVDDPDAPGGVYVHWVVYNLPATAAGLDEDAGAQGLPQDTEAGVNSRGNAGYTGMCPPSGSHRYRFKLYALDTQLKLHQPDKSTLVKAMQGHVIAKTKLTAHYRKH